MPYGLKYQNEFNNQSDEGVIQKTFTLQFLFKDYSGPVTSIEGGDTSVIQRCTVDDPVAPIKGQSLDITLLNEGSRLPITAFQSDDDDGVQVKLLEGSNVLFIGFLVQDDFYETLVDDEHTITLSANDSLGLLKGVPFDEAPVNYDLLYTSPVEPIETIAPDTLITGFGFGSTVLIGDRIRITGTAVAGDYTIVTATAGVTDYTFTVLETIGTLAATTAELSVLRQNNNFRITILSIIRRCLAVTNLSLITNIFHNLYEYRQDNTISTFEQTILDTQLFISGETYEDCYSVLTKIMEAFNCTVFQANGQWNIINWHEAVPKINWSYPNNAIPGFVYDEDWAAIGTTVFNNNFNIGPANPTTWLAGLQGGAVRGWKFSRKEFNYNQPKYLFKNYDLQQVGALLRQYTSGTDIIYEYTATDFFPGEGSIPAEYFIRVIYDTILLRESDRYLVVRGGTTTQPARIVASSPIEGNIGDKIRFSFSTRTNISQTPPFFAAFFVKLYEGGANPRTEYVDELPDGNGAWGLTGYSYTYTDNTNVWASFDIQSSQMPYSGLITCFFARNIDSARPPGPTDETWYKDIRFEYIPYINDSTKITGQIHKQTRLTGPKLNNDVEITIDDSPRNSIVGTLFLTTLTGLLQDRTLYWRYPPDANGWRLGELATLDELKLKQQTRSKLEGGFIGNYQGTVVSLLCIAIMDFNNTKNYTFGLLTIDYKRNQFSGTLWELYDTLQAVLDNTYTFTYKYSTE